jgi:hypothetical protein
MSIRTRKRLQRKTKISIVVIDRGLILFPTPSSPFPGVRCSVGLQRPRVTVPGRPRHLIVEIANVCPFFHHMIGIGSFREAGNAWPLRKSRQPNSRLNCTLDQWPKVQ